MNYGIIALSPSCLSLYGFRRLILLLSLAIRHSYAHTSPAYTTIIPIAKTVLLIVLVGVSQPTAASIMAPAIVGTCIMIFLIGYVVFGEANIDQVCAPRKGRAYFFCNYFLQNRQLNPRKNYTA